MKLDGFENERKSILYVWILNLLLPGVGLGTMYAGGSACLPILIAAWVYQLFALNLHVAIQCYIFLSVVGTFWAIANNVRFEERQRQALKALQSKADLRLSSEDSVTTSAEEIHALDTLERKVRQAEKILAQHREEELNSVSNEGQSVLLPKPSELHVLWTDKSSANAERHHLAELHSASDEVESGSLPKPSELPVMWTGNSSANAERHGLAEPPTAQSVEPSGAAATVESSIEIDKNQDLIRVQGVAEFPLESKWRQQPQVQQPPGSMEQPPVQTECPTSPLAEPTVEQPPVRIESPDPLLAEPIVEQPPVQIKSPTPLLAESADLVRSGKSELPSDSASAESVPTTASESQVQGFMQTLGDTVGTTYQQTPFPQPSFDFSFQRFEAPNYTFDFTGALEQPHSTEALEQSHSTSSSSAKSSTAKENCPHCNSPKHPEFSFCLRCGVSF